MSDGERQDATSRSPEIRANVEERIIPPSKGEALKLLTRQEGLQAERINPYVRRYVVFTSSYVSARAILRASPSSITWRATKPPR